MPAQRQRRPDVSVPGAVPSRFQPQPHCPPRRRAGARQRFGGHGGVYGPARGRSKSPPLCRFPSAGRPRTAAHRPAGRTPADNRDCIRVPPTDRCVDLPAAASGASTIIGSPLGNSAGIPRDSDTSVSSLSEGGNTNDIEFDDVDVPIWADCFPDMAAVQARFAMSALTAPCRRLLWNVMMRL